MSDWTQAIEAAFRLWDSTYGGGNVRADEDGFTCDEVGAIARAYGIDPGLLQAAVLAPRDGSRVTDGTGRSGTVVGHPAGTRRPSAVHVLVRWDQQPILTRMWWEDATKLTCIEETRP